MRKNFILVGAMASGKDEVAKIMRGYLRVAFGDEIRAIAKALRIDGVDRAYCCLCRLFDYRPPGDLREKLQGMQNIPKRNEKDRELLQELGTYCRMHYDLIWVRTVLDKISKDSNYVITDCRRRTELESCLQEGFVPIYIDADLEIRKQRLLDRDGGYDEKAFSHVAEIEIPELRHSCKWFIENNGTREELAEKVKAILKAEGVF